MILTPFLMDVGKVVGRMRPDWPLSSIHRALCSCGDKTEAEIALAAVRVASDPESRSPTRISLVGPWWSPVNFSEDKAQPGALMPPKYRREAIRAVPPPPSLIAETRAVLHAAATRHTEPEEGE